MRGLRRLSRPMLIAAVSAAAVMLAGCTAGAAAAPPQSSQQSTPQPTQQEVAGLFDQWNDALATRDAQVVADRYAPDAVLLPTLSNNVRSDRAEIVDYFEHFLQNSPQGAILESHVKVLGPTAAIDAGTYRFTLTTADGQQSTVDARYTFVYEKVGDQWLIVNHHSSAMPEGQPAGSEH
jgi:uncharacterized protein (TIGR02246 family)